MQFVDRGRALIAYRVTVLTIGHQLAYAAEVAFAVDSDDPWLWVRVTTGTHKAHWKAERVAHARAWYLAGQEIIDDLATCGRTFHKRNVSRVLG